MHCHLQDALPDVVTLQSDEFPPPEQAGLLEQHHTALLLQHSHLLTYGTPCFSLELPEDSSTPCGA